MRSQLSRTALALVAAAALMSAAACDDGNTTPTEPATQQDLDETARVVGALMAADKGGDMATLRDGAMSAQGQSGAGFALDVRGAFRGQHLGLSYDVELECYDGAGGTLSCSEGDASSADLVATWDGALNVGGLSIQSAMSADWMIDKLNTDTAIVDGDSSAVLDVSLTGPQSARSLHLAFTASYQGLQLAADTHRPVGGRVVYTLDVERRSTNAQGERVATLNADAVVTLGSDATATLEISGSRYLVNMDSGAVDRM
ncbi:MAG: hypothetical protein R3F39_02590 [Myxococcota bacterium]